jgi:hypothetical protein
MLDNPFPHLECQIQSPERSVAQLEILDDAQSVQVVIKRIAMLAHDAVERLFAGVPEWRMADIVRQSQRFHEVNIQPKLTADSARNLRHFDRVGKAISKVIGVTAGKNLGLVFQTAKSAGVDYAIPVPFEIIPVGMLGLGITASARFFRAHSVVSEHGEQSTSTK